MSRPGRRDDTSVLTKKPALLPAFSFGGAIPNAAGLAFEQRYPFDYYKLIATIPAEEAWLPLEKSVCPMVKKS